jgi:hypothetical protein
MDNNGIFFSFFFEGAMSNLTNFVDNDGLML